MELDSLFVGIVIAVTIFNLEASITHLTVEIEVEGKGCIDNCNEKLEASLALD